MNVGLSEQPSAATVSPLGSITLSESKLQFADTLRGVATLAVVIDHAFSLSGAGLLKVWPQFSLGQFGVALFFIISGFVIPLSLGKYHRMGFAISRAFRIYPTYWVAFSITVAVAYFQGKTYPAAELAQYYLLTRDFFGPVSIDPIVWTLLIEAKFYILCFCLMPLFVSRSRALFLIPLALLLYCLFFKALPPHRVFRVLYTASSMLIFMFVGVAFFLHYKKRISTASLWLSSLLCFAAMKLTWEAGPAAQFSVVAWSYLPAIPLFGICYSFRDKFSANRVFGFASNISYPLYVVHVPIITICIMIGSRYAYLPTATAPIGASFAILVAYLIHKQIETRSQVIGKRLAQSSLRTGSLSTAESQRAST